MVEYGRMHLGHAGVRVAACDELVSIFTAYIYPNVLMIILVEKKLTAKGWRGGPY